MPISGFWERTEDHKRSVPSFSSLIPQSAVLGGQVPAGVWLRLLWTLNVTCGTHLLQVLSRLLVFSSQILIGQDKELCRGGQAGEHRHQDVLGWDACGLRGKETEAHISSTEEAGRMHRVVHG